MSTIQDVAKEAGVSVATVSRVLNGSPSVKDSTREAVLQSIKKLNYQPNLLGRNLRRTETRLVLVLLPSISNPFYATIVKGIEDVGRRNGYNIMLCNTDSDKSRERMYINLLKNRLSDGMIFMAPELGKDELSSLGESYPIIQCCEYIEGANITHISIDNFSASYRAVKHLIGAGCTRIAMISSDNSFVSTKQREAGYRDALADAGISFDSSLLIYGDYGFKSGWRAANQLLSLDERPTAIFAISDVMAIGALRAIKEHGLKVPEDMAVMGFDNINFASMCDPLLTTISQPQYDLGRTSMELLIKRIRGEIKEPCGVFLEHELVVRESTIKIP